MITINVRYTDRHRDDESIIKHNGEFEDGMKNKRDWQTEIDSPNKQTITIIVSVFIYTSEQMTVRINKIKSDPCQEKSCTKQKQQQNRCSTKTNRQTHIQTRVKHS